MDQFVHPRIVSNFLVFRFLTIKLASQNWPLGKSVGDWFQICPAKGSVHPALKQTYLDENAGFEKFQLHPQLITSLKNMNVTICSSIQASAIPMIMQGDNVMVGAETGSGKTLAYLLPILHRILTEMDDQKAKEAAGNYDK